MNTEDQTKLGPVPSAPSCLCFTSHEFTKDDFSVDKFISEHKNKVQLECVRDDLNVYLNVLKSAMIELINKDYADFVNLSSNLVGLDKAINHLQIPLGQLREEILDVKSSVDNAVEIANEKLARKQVLREKKVKVQRIIGLHQRLGQLESSLNMSTGSYDSTPELSEEQVERMVIEVHQLKFDLEKSSGCPVSEQLRPRVDEVNQVMQTMLEQLFLASINKQDTCTLHRCLRTYASIDKVASVEALVATRLVRPSLQQLISEKQLKANGIDGIYERILAAIPLVCTNLLLVTTKSEDAIRGYDFLTNSVWPELVDLLETRMSSIFAPGNPTMFHKKYKSSMYLVEQFEQMYCSIVQVNRLRQHCKYLHFISKWNVPVYFQIRYQEIASALESCLVANGGLLSQAIENSGQVYKLKPCWQVQNCIESCWSSHIYIGAVAHLFWKLSLQIMSRFNSWLHHLSSKQTNVLSLNNKEEESNDYVSMMARGGVATANGNDNGTADQSEDSVNVHNIVLLVADIHALVPHLKTVYNEVISAELQAIGIKDTSPFQNAFTQLLDDISRHPQIFEDYLMSKVVIDCKLHLKLVADIPRLYRRTNKEIPAKPSGYITNILKPLQKFLNDHKETLLNNDSAAKRINLWKINVLEKVTEQYLSVTSDVLTSVKKTEDSLKRLKKARDRSNMNVAAASNTAMTDDDKIRLQLFLDVDNYGHQITLFEVETSSIKSYVKLMEVVESARHTPERC